MHSASLLPPRRRRALFAVLATALLGVVAPTVFARSASAVTLVPVAVTITSISCIEDCDEGGLEALGESTPDFYAKVWINGIETITPRRQG